MKVLKGLLGWSNKRVGLEFYSYNEKFVPRHGTEWGDLLLDELGQPEGNYEGCPVIVIVMDRKSTSEEVQELFDGITSSIVAEN